MGAGYRQRFSAHKARGYLLALFFLHAAFEQYCPAAKHIFQRAVVLIRQYLSRRHERGTVSVFNGRIYGKKRAGSFAAANIALNKPVHLNVFSHVR